MFDHAPLDRLFRPRSIAIIGASANAAKIGGIPVALLRQMGYAGAIHPVNPGATEVQGLRCHAHVRDIGEAVDVAIIALPMAAAEGALLDVVQAGIPSAVLFTSGYAEVGEAGRAAQQRLRDIARRSGARLLGPNCLGFMNLRGNVYATFSPAPQAGRTPVGNIGLVSQSGAFGIYAYAMARERGMGLSYWVSTGNECDIEFADVVAWLARDDSTRVILGYMEGCRDGAKLKAALQLAREAGKPVVITKVGRSTAGAAAAASHTAALAGDDAVFDALVRQYGAMRTHTIDDFFNAGYALSKAPRPRRGGLGIMTVSGGVGALMADDAAECGLDLPELPAEAQRRIIERVPFAAPRNPVDITGQVTSEPGLMTFAARTMLDSGCYGSLLGFFAGAGTSATILPHILEHARTLRDAYPDVPLALCSLFTPQARQALEEMGCLVFADPSAAIRALRLLAATATSAVQASAPDVPGPAMALPTGALNEPDSIAVLKAAGLPVVPLVHVRSADAAVVAAERIGHPVVLKVVSRDILHKSDVGGVRLKLADAAEVRQAHDELLADVRRALPDAHIDGVLVAPMAAAGVECILGVQRDPTYGPVIMVGLGGVLVEVLRDVSLRLAPFDRREALAMIDELRGRRLLDAHRGRASADMGALADALVALSKLAVAAGDRLESIDVNPFIVHAQGAVAVDGVVIGRAPAGLT